MSIRSRISVVAAVAVLLLGAASAGAMNMNKPKTKASALTSTTSKTGNQKPQGGPVVRHVPTGRAAVFRGSCGAWKSAAGAAKARGDRAGYQQAIAIYAECMDRQNSGAAGANVIFEIGTGSFGMGF
jgi:hypothetical protein